MQKLAGPRGDTGAAEQWQDPREVRVYFQFRGQGLLSVQRSGSTSSSEVSNQQRAHGTSFLTEKVRQERGRKYRGYFFIPVSKKKQCFPSLLLSPKSKKKKRINKRTPKQIKVSTLLMWQEVTADVDKGCHLPDTH